MIAATVQGDVDGIPQGSHYASVPMIKPIGTLVGSATATLEDRLTAAVSTPNPSADGLQRDLLSVSGPSLVAVAPDRCVAAGESDRPTFEKVKRFLLWKPGCTNYTDRYNTSGYNGSTRSRMTPTIHSVAVVMWNPARSRLPAAGATIL